jgi:GH15 family glucan-1,4-alpha-glucosidase
MDHHVAGLPVTDGPDRGAATVQQFLRAPASLADSVHFADTDAGVGLSKTVHLEAGQRTTLAFFYAVKSSVAAANATAMATKALPAQMLVAESSSRWKAWLDSGKASSAQTPVPAWADALRVVMLTTRQAQQPEFGTFVASTNPAYFYSIWPRDSSVTAMGLDAAGYLAEAEKYWTWMASVQEQGVNKDYPKGTYYTNYSFWQKQLGIRFVYPEWDSIGLFLVGVYRHHEALAAIDAQHASAFLSQVWPAVQGAANFIELGAKDPANYGFGWQDNSIWEEDLAYQAFTQTTYVAGLRASELLAAKRGEDGSHWGVTSDQIRDAIFRPSSTSKPCPGLWSDQGRYFIRSVKPDCKTDARVDSATQLLWVFGVLAQDDPAAADHRRAVLFNLSPGEWGFGVARYEHDEFYHANTASPGGMFEAGAATPLWPQATMEMTMLEHWHGLDMLATDRLSWEVATMPTGFEPQGEPVDWTTQQPIVSTASEPVTGAWYVLGLLNQIGLFDPRLPPRSTWRSVANADYPRY